MLGSDLLFIKYAKYTMCLEQPAPIQLLCNGNIAIGGEYPLSPGYKNSYAACVPHTNWYGILKQSEQMFYRHFATHLHTHTHILDLCVCMFGIQNGASVLFGFVLGRCVCLSIFWFNLKRLEWPSMQSPNSRAAEQLFRGRARED